MVCAFRTIWMVGLLAFFFGCTAQRSAPSPYLHPIAEVPPSAPTTPAPAAPQPNHASEAKSGSSTGKPLVFLDPGHGGREVGAQNIPRRLQEKRITLDIAKRAERLLVGRGYPVRLSRTKDVVVSLQKRVLIAERRAAAVFVSIHVNSSPKRDTTGAEVFYYATKERNTPERIRASRRLGTTILNSLCRTMPTTSRGLKDGDFCVIRETTMPSVLVEVAFITNPKESLLLTTGTHKQRIAQAIANGIDEFFSGKGAR